MKGPGAQMDTPNQSVDGKKYLIAFLLSLIPMAGNALTVSLALDRDITDLVLTALTIFLLFWILPEKTQFGRLSLLLLLAGLVTGLIVFRVRSAGSQDLIQVTTSNGLLGVAVFMFNAAVLTPIYEEKACRQIMLFGLGKYLHIALSAVVVSVLFSVVHHGNEIFALVFSLIMCACAAKGMSTFNRAFIHGGVNLAQTALWVYYGYKF
jgi:membrane protease YdiL (CAAX protease family)